MKVIKVVYERKDGRLVSTFAPGEWEKEYAEGVETKPDVGYLFAYSSRNLKMAKDHCPFAQYWLAEAEVVGRVSHCNIYLTRSGWRNFWKGLKLQLRAPGAEYLLCSSIILIRRLA